MTNDLITRLLVSVGIVLIGIAGYWLANRFILQRVGVHSSISLTAGKPTILYFTTPTCAPCKTVQRPTLLRLQERVGDGVEVVEIDAATRPDVASQWGVLSVPTTFIIDASGRPRHVNHGVASLEKLLKQIDTLN